MAAATVTNVTCDDTKRDRLTHRAAHEQSCVTWGQGSQTGRGEVVRHSKSRGDSDTVERAGGSLVRDMGPSALLTKAGFRERTVWVW